ncbi:hypothetical protein GRAN_3933 [Granulicella sibirica]|uniref:IPT/TIG domain-containing protein n=2 Tax=Granulicella sibirica TaxID=2479048 RepID=A0A4Q0SZ64_9BACT|nr:hypothetical protein GRAN_3933 [Granulicella sibirica]
MLLGVCLGCLLGGPARAQETPPVVEATTIATAGPAGVAYDSAGNLYVVLRDDHRVLKVDTAGLVTTVAGTGEQGFGGDGGAATSALLDSPAGIAVDGSGNLFVADSHNQRVREISGGTITTVAGTGVAGFGGDGGGATAAVLDLPVAVSVDGAGNVYIADSGNHRIRKVSGGVIATVAGDGEQTFSGDGGLATAAGLDSPGGVVADTVVAGRVYISDTHNQRVRMVGVDGMISTVAGNGVGGSADGTGTVAELTRPLGLGIGTTGTVYVADSGNNKIRAIGATVTTVAGDGEQGFAGDTGSVVAAVLDSPRAVAAGANGSFALADTHNQRTRVVAGGAINTVAGIAPASTEGIVLEGVVSSVYGNGSVTANFSNGGKSATGMATLLDGGTSVGTVAWAANQASFSLAGLNAGLHALAVSYAGDASNAATASGLYLVTTTQAEQRVAFTQPVTPIVYAPGLTVALSATSSVGLPVTYTVASGPATVTGSTLAITGGGTVVVTAQAGNTDYAMAKANRTIVVSQATPAVAWAAPADVVYGTALGAGQLNASSAVPGSFTYSPNAGAVPGGGAQTLSVTFTPNDAASYVSVTQTVRLTVRQAMPTVTFPAPPYAIVGTSLSAVAFNPSAVGVTGAALNGTFAYTFAAGALVAAGPQVISATFTPNDLVDYAVTTASVTLSGTALGLASLSPAMASLGDAAKTVVLTGAGFASDASVLVNNAAVKTTFGNNGSLMAVIPAAAFTTVQTLQISVYDPTQKQTSGLLPFAVKAPGVSYTVSAPTTSDPGTQPTVTLTLTNPYPVEVDGVFTLSFTPSGNGVDDPAIQFASGGRTMKFTVGAGQTVAPNVMLQTGTVSGVIAIGLTLNAGGADVTPAGTAPTSITVPSVVPSVTAVAVARSGRTLTVTANGFSNTREVTQAAFHFLPVAGQQIQTPDVTLDVTSLFAGWYGSADSDAYGSSFLYTQVFTLDEDASVVGTVDVTLTNGVGTSGSGSSQ